MRYTKQKVLVIFTFLVVLMIYISLKIYRTEHFDSQVTHNYLAYYTVFCGARNNAAFNIPPVPSESNDCYYYTNNPELFESLKSTKWIPRRLDIQVSDDEIESCMAAKHIKACPHMYEDLKKYKYTCFQDSKLRVIDSLCKELIQKNMPQYSMILRQHLFLQPNIYNEFNESMKQPRYVKQKTQYEAYIQKQLQAGLSETTPQHIQCGYIVRDMTSPIIKRINETWYEHIQECGIQDQISFFFVKQLFPTSILGVDRTVYN